MTPPNFPGLRIDFCVSATPEYAETVGRTLLKLAEENRREPNGGFNSSAIAGAPPAADWASAGMIVSDAATVLNEALPNGQRLRSEAALGALIVGVTMLRAAMKLRSVEPMMLLLGDANANSDATTTTPPQG